MKRNAILFSRVDREDLWVSSGIVFKVNNTSTYEEAYDEIKHQLETPEMIAYVIEDNCLEDDLFDGDETFKFSHTYWANALYFVFTNEEGCEVEHRMAPDFVLVN